MASQPSNSKTLSAAGSGQRVLSQVTDSPPSQLETMPTTSDNLGVSPSPLVAPPRQQNLTQLGRPYPVTELCHWHIVYVLQVQHTGKG